MNTEDFCFLSSIQHTHSEFDRSGDKSVMHEHPDSVVYVLAPLKRRFFFPDRKAADAELKPGQVIWNKAGKHAGENTGTIDSHVLIIELKQSPR
jgi:uncharacterized RmlC-like cupin family protein